MLLWQILKPSSKRALMTYQREAYGQALVPPLAQAPKVEVKLDLDQEELRLIQVGKTMAQAKLRE